MLAAAAIEALNIMEEDPGTKSVVSLNSLLLVLVRRDPRGKLPLGGDFPFLIPVD